MTPPSLIDRLAAHRTIGSVPRDQLAWLAAVGRESTLEPGDVLSQTAGIATGLYIVLDGLLSIHIDHGAGPRRVMEWRAGDVTGLLPYSRMKASPGTVVAEQRTSVLTVDAADFPRMIRECHELTATLVHVMLDRARTFTSSELLDEKMASLGRLAAGLAHELNNPASAAARSAKTLAAELAVLEDATRRFCALNLSDAQCRAIAAVCDELPAAEVTPSPLDTADRQDAIAGWLEEHGVSGVDVEPLAESAFSPAALDALRATVGADKLGDVLAHISAGQTVRRLAGEIDAAATRIHSLVAAVRGFTSVDQQAALQPMAVGKGLSDTLTVLRSKARSKSVDLDLRVAPDLPAVDGYGGELNQVWANLVDNAIDAAPGGHVRVLADAADGKVVVRVIDDGPGVAPDAVGRIFDPFFTTKATGEGTGLGLDITRRIVQRHRGQIELRTGSGGTEFRVTLPASTAGGKAR